MSFSNKSTLLELKVFISNICKYAEKQPMFLEHPIYIRAPDVKEKSNDLIDIYN